VAAAIEGWFRRNARDLPWRRRRSAWGALVSEIMLQQTQVARVLERFDPFMARFPSPGALARASEDEVLRHWQGLGYYRRARHLRAAAIFIESQLGGEVPLDVPTLMQLSGVGRYTAGSMASIVGGAREPIVDGNITRVIARLEGDGAPVSDPAFVQRKWDHAQRLVEASASPALLNEGLMELGAVVCLPANPTCDACPLKNDCQSRAAGTTSSIPQPKARTRQQAVHHHTVIILRRGHLLLEQRPTNGLWGGLWQPPTVESRRRLPEAKILDGLSLPLASIQARGALRRQLTHRIVHMHLHEGVLTPRARVAAKPGRQWVPQRHLNRIPLSNAARAALATVLAD